MSRTSRFVIAIASSLVAAPAALASLTSGCASDEVIKPVGSSTGSGTGGSTAVTPDAGPIKRTVTQRNPFGNVAETNNLLYDGDFEWSSPFSDQYGWFEGQNPTVSDVRIGAECHSGIKCARIAKHVQLIGLGVSSRDSALYASVWVRFEDATTACKKATVTVFGGASAGDIGGNDPDVELDAPAAPDDSGWCKLEGIAAVRKNKAYLLVENGSNSNMIVDDAVLVETTAPPVALDPDGPANVSAEHAANLASARGVVHEYEKPHDGPPTAARKAFEAHHQKDSL